MKGRLKDFRRPRSLLIYSKGMLCVQGMRTITPLWAGVKGVQNSVPCKILQFDYVSKSAFKINRRLLQFTGDCGLLAIAAGSLPTGVLYAVLKPKQPVVVETEQAVIG